ncbi:hypothetical protein EMCRGX_G010063 [Ephydatia muelleri]
MLCSYRLLFLLCIHEKILCIKYFASWTQNVLLAVNTGGVCSIFTTESRPSPHSSPKTAGAGATIEIPKSSVPPLKKLHSQELLPNVKVAIVASLAPDGTHELFVGLTDRVVGAFRWNEASSSLELRQKWILTGQNGSSSALVSRCCRASACRPSYLVSVGEVESGTRPSRLGVCHFCEVPSRPTPKADVLYSGLHTPNVVVRFWVAHYEWLAIGL